MSFLFQVWFSLKTFLLKTFLLKNISEKERTKFSESTNRNLPENTDKLGTDDGAGDGSDSTKQE